MSDDLKEELADMLRRGVDASTWCRHAEQRAPKPVLTVGTLGPSAPQPTSSTIPPEGELIDLDQHRTRSHE